MAGMKARSCRRQSTRNERLGNTHHPENLARSCIANKSDPLAVPVIVEMAALDGCGRAIRVKQPHALATWVPDAGIYHPFGARVLEALRQLPRCLVAVRIEG